MTAAEIRVAEVLLAKQPAPGADLFVYGDEDQGDD